MSTELLETGDMMVVTVRVPTTSAEKLSVEVAGHLVTIVGPAGFRHALTMPAVADLDRLHADLYQGILELRAPRQDGNDGALRRTVPVRTLAY
jgi:HSP20 family molecular chaperone IbpA